MNDIKNLNCLLPKTKNVLEKIIEQCPFIDEFVLVGGSALSLYLCHRQSEDLDFFTYSNTFSKEKIFNFISIFETKEIINEDEGQIDVLLDHVKVTFFDAQWSFLQPHNKNTLHIATLEHIAAMKVNTIFLRATYRDYYDIYCLAKYKMSLFQMFEQSKQIIPGLTFKLFCTALLFTDDIADDHIDHLAPTEKINKYEIRDFFENILKDKART